MTDIAFFGIWLIGIPAVIMIRFMHSRHQSGFSMFWRRKRVGATYWGMYPDSDDSQNGATIPLPKPCGPITPAAAGRQVRR